MKLGIIEWYYNVNTHDVLGFYSFEGGFYIIGGATGSHHSGHAETPYEKEQDLLNNGYVPVIVAIEKGIIDHDWQAPDISNSKDRRIIAHLDKIQGFLRYQHLKPWWVIR